MEKSKPRLLIHKGEKITHQEMIEGFLSQAASSAIPHIHDEYGEQIFIADADYYVQFIKKNIKT